MKATVIFLCLLQVSLSHPLQSVRLDGNNISTLYWTSGIFNQNMNSSNAPGFEWPKGSGKYAIFTTGLSIAAYLNGNLRMGQASYRGEYSPGYCVNGQFLTDSRFKFYRIKRGDNYINNPDWLNWGLMVPYGAPFVDVNNNGQYNYFIDTPGVKSASQTIFICITDADPLEHKVGEGFGGSTLPLYAEVHFTAWCYDNPGYQDMQFLKWTVLNKSTVSWDSARFCIFSDCDLGWADDDYVGCDTTRMLSYCYNGDNDDNLTQVSWAYGLNPPAVGIAFLGCNNLTARFISSTYVNNTSPPGPACERDANGEPGGAYNFMRGLKKDRTPWVIPNTNPPQPTKFCYSGDPESTLGWTEFKGSVQNCGGSLTGNTVPVNPLGDRRSLITYGGENLIINTGDTFTITAVQLIARGNSHVNSVTKLKEITDKAHELCRNGFVIGINQISTEIPETFYLEQNYPNPFNPVTKIRFRLPNSENVKIKIFDVTGREISELVNEKLSAGIYSVDWDGSNYPSGAYFYQITAGNFAETRKMILIK